MEFVVNLDKPVEKSLVVSFSTSSTAKEGVASTGSAKGEVDCDTAGADFVSIPKQITIAAGSRSGSLTVEICPDAVFEPNETLNVNWTSAGAAGGVVTGTIINDDAGGLNGTGATTLLGGLPAYGRDVNSLTNSATDGALGFSFDKSNPECVVDKVTGLTWQKTPGVTKVYADISDPLGTFAYAASVNAALSPPCGFTDWRVPTVNELLSLMDASKTTGNAVNADGETMTGQFWTSESQAVPGIVPATQAWQVDVTNGGVVSLVSKTDTLGVRLVRGEPRSLLSCSTDSRFTDSLDGTIDDSITGLMWKKCPEGYAYSAGVCTAGSKIAFTGATEVVTQLTDTNAAKTAGYSDWRVPTKNELASIVSRACIDVPSIDPKFFLGTDNLSFVTATLDADAPLTSVWNVKFNARTTVANVATDSNGAIGPNTLTAPFSLRLVRAGQ